MTPPVSERPRRVAAIDAARRVRAEAVRKVRQAGGAVRRDLAAESRRRRIFWALLAVVLILGPVAFNAARAPAFSSQVEIFPRDVGPFPAITNKGYYEALLADPQLRLGMEEGVGARAPEWRRVILGRVPAHHSLFVALRDTDPARTREFVNALASQIANATGRQLLVEAQRRAGVLTVRARAAKQRSVAIRLRRRAAAMLKLAQALPQRIVLGRSAGPPKLTHWTDRFADSLPGAFPLRADPMAAGLAGLVVLVGLWVLGLFAFPPGGRRPRPRRAAVVAAAPAAPPAPAPAPAGPQPAQALPAEPRAERPPRAPSRWTTGPQLDLEIERSTGVQPRAAIVLFALICVAAGALIFLSQHGAFFFGDDWDMVLRRFGLSTDTLLQPHVNHLVATQVLYYEGVRAVAGWHYGAYRLAFLLLQLSIAAGVFVFARPRLGGWPAAVLVVPMLLIPGHATTIFTAGNVIALLTGLAAILVLDRAPANHLRDAAVCVLLLLAVASFSFGLAFAVAVAIWLVATPGQRRSLWVPAVPVVAYLAWLLSYHPPSPLSLHNLADTPAFVGDSAAAAFAAVTGLGFAWGRLLALLAAVAVGYELFTKPDRRSPTTYAIVALPILLWTLVGLGRAAAGPEAPPFAVGSDDLLQRFVHLNGTVVAGQSRYVYASVVLLLLVAAQLLARRRLRPVVGVAVVMLLAGVVTNVVLMRDTGNTLRGIADQVRGRIAAAEIAARTIPPGFGLQNFPGGPDKNLQYIANFQAFIFKDAVNRVGSEPVPLGALGGLGTPGRRELDAVLVNALPVRMVPAPAGPPPKRAGCTAVQPAPKPKPLAARGVRTVIRAGAQPATVSLRRFADPAASASVGTVAARTNAALTIPRDRSRQPWSVLVVSTTPVSVCSS